MKHHRAFSTSIGLVGLVAVLIMLAMLISAGGGRGGGGGGVEMAPEDDLAGAGGREPTPQPRAAEPERPTMCFAPPTRIPAPVDGARGWPSAVVLARDGSISLEFDAPPTPGRSIPFMVPIISIDDDGSRYAGLIDRNTTGKDQLSLDTSGICALVLEEDGSWTIEQIRSGLVTTHGIFPPTFKQKNSNVSVEAMSRPRFKEISTEIPRKPRALQGVRGGAGGFSQLHSPR